MFRTSWVLWAVGAVGVAVVPIAAVAFRGASGGPSQISASQPVVIELFTSEGCSSCPPADRVLAQLAESGLDGIPIIALSEHVDYWDRLGWKDPFSAARFTDRQQQYADVLRSDVYTPQMVVDGRRQLVGSDRASAVDEIRKAAGARKLDVKAEATRHGAELVVTAKVHVADGGRTPKADVVVAITENGLESNVLRGENQGRRLTHAAVTRYLSQAVRLDARATEGVTVRVKVDPAWRLERSKAVVIVQSPIDLSVLGAASVALDANLQTTLE